MVSSDGKCALDDEAELDEFDFIEEDYFAASLANNVTRLILNKCQLTAGQVVGLAHALYALERLPEVTHGIDCEYSISYRGGDEETGGLWYASILISDQEFAIETGGSTYDKQVGSDSYSGLEWRISIDGDYTRELEMELFDLEDMVVEFLNLGVEITVDDETDWKGGDLTTRPYRNCSAQELRKIYLESTGDFVVLQQLLGELQYRSGEESQYILKGITDQPRLERRG